VADDAVRCEPVSASNSLIIRKIQVISAFLAPGCRQDRRKTKGLRRFFQQIPYSTEQRILLADQGIFRVERGNWGCERGGANPLRFRCGWSFEEAQPHRLRIHVLKAVRSRSRDSRLWFSLRRTSVDRGRSLLAFAPVPIFERMGFSAGTGQFIEQSFRFLQIRGVEPFGETSIKRGEKFARLRGASERLEHTTEAGRRTQLE
jgi:hypothetical protein